MNKPSGNNEHKFTIDLGSDPSTIAAQSAVSGSWLVSNNATTLPISWEGHVGGTSGIVVEFELWLVTWGEDCQSGGDMTMCLMGTSGELTLTGNSTPMCISVDDFSGECTVGKMLSNYNFFEYWCNWDWV